MLDIVFLLLLAKRFQVLKTLEGYGLNWYGVLLKLISKEELYDPYKDPQKLTLGQLSDDLEEIRKIAREETGPVSLDFVKVSSILAAIGHKTVW